MPETILIMQPLPAIALEYLRAESADVLLAYDGDDWKARAADIRALVYYSVKVDRALVDQLPALEVIGKRGVGIDTIDLSVTSARGIRITNIQGEDGNAASVAEHSLALLMATRRRIPERDAFTRRGEFAHRMRLPLCNEVSGSRVGIVGAGNIGRRIGDMLAAAFGCPIGYYDPYISAERAQAFQATRFDQVTPLFEWADNVIVAAPLTPESRNLIGRRELALLGPQGVLVVISRGGIVNERDLAAALTAEQIWGAGLDVYDGEPPAADNPLFACDTVVLTPHVAGATQESRERTSLGICRQVIALLRGGEAPLADQEWL